MARLTARHHREPVVRRHARTFAAAAAIALTTGFIVMVAPNAGANISGNNIFPNLTGGFQIDGDLSAATGITTAGSIDWNSPALAPQPVGVDPVGTADTSVLSNGSKESDYNNWALNGSAGTSTKADVGNIYFYSQILDVASTPHLFGYLGVERLGNTGTVEYTVELNQRTTTHLSTGGIAIPDRKIGDLRLKIFNQGSNGLSVGGTSSKWVCTTPADEYPGSEKTCDWDAEQPIPAAAISGLVNEGSVADPFPSQVTSGGNLDAQQFVEVGLDLTALVAAHAIVPGCPSNITFGQLNLRSRASTSIGSELKDIVQPIPIHMPTLCAGLRIEKRDTQGNLIPGASFLISPNPNTGTGSLTATDGGANDLTLGGTQAPADGVVQFFNAKPGSYTISESSPPAGWIPDPAPQTKTAVARTDTTFTFTDRLGTVTFQKVDAGTGLKICCATFTVHRVSGDGTQADVVVTDNSAPDQDPAAGVIKLIGLKTGSYTITETAAPADYNLPANAVQNFTISAQSADVVQATAFQDPRKVGYLRIVKKLVDENGAPVVPKPDLSVLNGTTFVVYQDANNNGSLDAGEESHLWPNPPADGSDIATCVITGGLGYCDVGPLALGNYRIAETVRPLGTTSAGDVNAVVTETSANAPTSVNYTNVLTPLQITLDKTGPDTANVGDNITYTFTVTTSGPRLHNIVLTDDTGLCDSAPTGPTGDTNNNGFLEVGESWVYTCHHVITMSDPDPLVNTATAKGTDDFGRDVSDSDNHTVDILYPDVTVTKTADDSMISAGDTAGFTLTLTVGGDNGSIARSVTLTDSPLPSGLSWTFVTPVAGCSIANGALTCNFGDLAKGATRTIHLTAPTTALNCGTLDNTVTVAATNEKVTNNNTASASITVDCPNVKVVKTTDTPTVSAGDDMHFSITVSNTSASATAKGVTLSDPLPSGVTWTLGGADAGACSIANQAVSCTFGDLSPLATRTITLSATSVPALCGTVTNTATVHATNEPDNQSGDNVSTATVTVNCPNITVIKTADNPTINATDQAAYTILVSNSGTGTAKAATLDDPLPGGLAWSQDNANCSIAAGLLHCEFGDLAPGATVTVHLTAPTTAADCGTLTNIATVVASNERTADHADNVSTATITINCPDVRIVKSAVVGTVSATDPVSFSITVDNHGVGASYVTDVTDVLPTGIDWSVDNQLCSISGGVLTCHLGTLLPGADHSVTVTLSGTSTVGSCPSISNTATVHSNNEPADTETLADNTSTAVITVNCPDVRVVKSAVVDTIDVGGNASFKITVDNHGAGAAYNVVLTDVLPTGLSWTVDDTEDCTITEGTLTCNFGTVQPGVEAARSVVLTAATTSNSCPSVPNTATVVASNESLAADVQDDNTSSASVTVNCHPAISIVKSVAGTQPFVEGDTATFSYVVTNTGDVPLHDVAVTDDILGFIGTIGDLAVGATSAPLTKSEIVHVVTTPTTPTTNIATATGISPQGVTVQATDTVTIATTIITPPTTPKISIVKSSDSKEYGEGDTATFTYVVKNTGEEPLHDVVVVDDILGNIGTIGDLAIGETRTLKKTEKIVYTNGKPTTPATNVATVTGIGVNGTKVTDTSTVTIAFRITEAPVTGAEVARPMQWAVGFMLVGALSIAVSSRRRRRTDGGPSL